MAIVAGVDSSTQSCTVELRDVDTGGLLGSGSAPHPSTNPPVSEHDPEAWWTALRVALAAACTHANVSAAAIDAVAVDAQCHGMVTLDGENRPVRAAKLWNDTTSAPQARRLVDRLGAEFWVGAVGSVLSPAFIVTKLAWLREAEPDRFDRVHTVLLPHDYLTWRLSGELVTDRADASGTGYYSPRENRWLPDLLGTGVGVEGWSPRLPTVQGPTDAAGTASTDAVADLGLRGDVVIGPGTGDQYASALGLGIGLGDVVVGLGTSGVVFSVSPEPVGDPSGWVNGMADATGRFMPIVVSLNATRVTAWAARLLSVDLEVLSSLALADTASGLERPLVAAFFDGERAPNRPFARGMMARLTTGTSRESFARAVFEGVILGLVRGIDAIEAAGCPVDGRLVLTGGGARSDAYRHVLADVAGREVTVLDVAESSARGACVQAAAVLSGADIDDVVRAWAPTPAQVVEPTPGGSRVDRGSYARLADWPGMDLEPETGD